VKLLFLALGAIPAMSFGQGVFRLSDWENLDKAAAPYVLLGVFRDKSYQREIGFTALSALIVNEFGLKQAFHIQRPNQSGGGSFPSTHATTTFTIASAQASLHPKEAIYWYAGATLISVSKVAENAHSWLDITAGATLGYYAGRWAVSSNPPFQFHTTPRSITLNWNF
jgi:membrane-associated phospholipid phosphatase